MHGKIAHDVQNVYNFESLVSFLRDTLNWPIPDEGLEFDDITFDWSAVDLELDADTQARVIGCRQLQLFDLKFDLSAVTREFNANTQASQQLQLINFSLLESQRPWGIFFIEFNDDVELDACRTLCVECYEGWLTDPPAVLHSLFGTTTKFSLSAPPQTFRTSVLLASGEGEVVLLLMTIFP